MIKCQQITDLLSDGQSWQTARAESKLGFQVMAEIIQASRKIAVNMRYMLKVSENLILL